MSIDEETQARIIVAGIWFFGFGAGMLAAFVLNGVM